MKLAALAVLTTFLTHSPMAMADDNLAHGTKVHVIGANGKINLITAKVAYIEGETNDDTNASFQRDMDRTEGLPGDRLIIIDSPGGYTDAGDKFIERIEREKASKVRVVCFVLSEAHSMAFNILTHCDVRLANSTAEFIVHKLAGSGLPPGERGTAKNWRRYALHLETMDEPYREANANAMHLSLKVYDLLADEETLWRTTRLLELGYLYSVAHLAK